MCLIIHRVGLITPGESIVLTAAWAAHREAAFEASRYLMEELKSNAPFWKKEITDRRRALGARCTQRAAKALLNQNKQRCSAALHIQQDLFVSTAEHLAQLFDIFHRAPID